MWSSPDRPVIGSKEVMSPNADSFSVPPFCGAGAGCVPCARARPEAAMIPAAAPSNVLRFMSVSLFLGQGGTGLNARFRQQFGVVAGDQVPRPQRAPGGRFQRASVRRDRAARAEPAA
jgi:hypothetical protein